MRALPARSALVNASVVPAATIGANVFSYALLLVAARELSSASYGELSALLGVLLIATVPMLAMQTVIARRTAITDLDAETTDPSGLIAAAGVAAIGTAAVVLIITPALHAFLHLSSFLGPVLIAASVVPNTALGAMMGRAQGRQHFYRLAGVTAMATIGRSLGGLIGLLVGRTTVWTLAGVCLGLTAVAALAGRPHLGATRRAISARHRRGSWPVLAEATHAAHAHAAFLVVTSLDVLLARHLLSADDAGRYAVGSVVTRAALWLPQSVGLMLFADMAIPQRHRLAVRRAYAAVLAIGTASVIGCLALGPLVVSLVGGAKYRHLGTDIWLFALLGVFLALIQLAVLAGLAQRRQRRVLLLWLTGVLDIAGVFALGDDATTLRIAAVLSLVAGVAAGLGAVLTVRAPARGDPRAQLDVGAGQA
jgi:O-antigen/teichoic acid export membrane protein